MIISNKRNIHKTLPNTIQLGNLIKFVNNFKLLDVLLDNRLNYNDYNATLSKRIDSNLFSIKRLFFLPFEVKLQFFKTFIYLSSTLAFSVTIYFSCSAINKLIHTYYGSLFKLFKSIFNNQSVIKIKDFCYRTV